MSYYTSSRRKRYTVYSEGREPFVILAYSAEQVREHYAHRPGLRVVAGDYRTKAKVAAKSKGGPKFTVDHRAVKEACKLLGVRLPVKIRTHARVGNTNGNHRFKGLHHDIMIKSYIPAEEISETLWHELTHAMQAERAIDQGKSWDAVYAEQRRYPYRIRPIEIEARTKASEMKHILQLCRPI